MKLIGSNIIRREKIISTSDEAKKIAAQSSEGTVVIADEQSGGRGKPGSSWFSPKDVGLYFSVILKPYKNPNELAAFTLLSANAVIDAVKQLYNLTAAVKLPNDVIVSEKKLCGILTERTKDALIIGMGINVSTKHFPEEIKNSATSISLELGRDVEKNILFLETLRCLDEEYLKFLKSGV